MRVKYVMMIIWKFVEVLNVNVFKIFFYVVTYIDNLKLNNVGFFFIIRILFVFTISIPTHVNEHIYHLRDDDQTKT